MRIFVIAGEPSGDRLGAARMGGLKALAPGVEFRGVGGSGMEGEGLESLFPMEELSVMGIAEVLPKYRHRVKRMHQTAEAVLAEKPEVLITTASRPAPSISRGLSFTSRPSAPRAPGLISRSFTRMPSSFFLVFVIFSLLCLRSVFITEAACLRISS